MNTLELTMLAQSILILAGPLISYAISAYVTHRFLARNDK